MRRSVTGEMLNIYYNVKSKKKEGTRLIGVVPRALYKGEIYEIFITDEKDAKPDGLITNYAILGHFEVKDAGLIRTGDKVSVANKEVGKIIGYAPCKVLRAPEQAIIHIFATNDKIVTSEDLNLKLGDQITFTPIDTEYK